MLEVLDTVLAALVVGMLVGIAVILYAYFKTDQ